MLLVGRGSVQAQTPMEAFHWIDFHDPKDAPTVTWVNQEMKAEKWSAIREIGVLWDSAVVITTLRESPQAMPASDVTTVWSVSLAKHEVQPLLHGVKLRILDTTSFGGAMMPEVAIVYDDCSGCDATTSFTTIHYSNPDHAWRARWMRGNQAAALWNTGSVEGVVRTQAYALITAPGGRDVLGTWTRFDYGKVKPAEDFLFEYSVDLSTGLDQTQGLSAKHAEEMMAKICHPASPGGDTPVETAQGELTRGQDSSLCQELPAAKTKARVGRRPTTTPPANNRGQSSPPPARGQVKPAAPKPAGPDATKPK